MKAAVVHDFDRPPAIEDPRLVFAPAAAADAGVVDTTAAATV